MTASLASGRDAIRGVIDRARDHDVEVLTVVSEQGATRFAGSRITQNVVRNEVRAYVRVAYAGRSAVSATTRLDEEGLRAAAARARAAAVSSVDDPDFPGLPTPDEVGTPEPLWRFDEATATCSPARRATAVRSMLGSAGKHSAAGYVETVATWIEIASSTGLSSRDAYTRAGVQCLVDTGRGTGWGEGYSTAFDEVDVAAVAGRARATAQKASGPVRIEAGERAVVLAPGATATMLEYLGYSGFSAKSVLDGESFLATRTGTRVAAPGVTIADDVHHPLSIGPAFDLEGCPRRRVVVIDDGVARRPVTDRRTAPLVGLDATGHFSGSAEVGPYASHLVMAPGDATAEELIEGVDDGLFVTRFHYVNLLDRPTALLTGMTRDGTFRIRDGELAEAVVNMRFATSALDALASVEAVGNDQRAFAESWGSTVAPSVRVGSFSFSSATTH